MSRPLVFICSVAIVLAAVLGYFLSDRAHDRVKQASGDLFSPVWRSVDWVKGKFGGMEDSFKTVEELQTEVRRLHDENIMLSAERTVLRALAEENARLKEMLGFQDGSNYRLLAARVIQRDPSSWWNTVIINRGWRDDPELDRDQPVVGPRGVVGKTGEVSAYTTRIILLVDENCKISAVTEVSRSRGIVQGGTAINSGRPFCRLNFVSRESEITVGERVFTTGLGGTFPANLLIGIVQEAPPLSADRNFGLYREAVVQPLVDLNNLEEVFIILGVK